MTMLDWINRLHEFLSMTGRDLLTHAGSISHDEAMLKAHEEYEKFRQAQLDTPTKVEKHFIEAEKELKKIEGMQKKVRR